MSRDKLDRYYTPPELARACVRAVMDELGSVEGWPVSVEDLHVRAE